MTTWHPDILDGYESTDLPLPGAQPAPGEPEDAELVATLVRRCPTPDAPRVAGAPALLYVHGWNDYFFQTHLADAVAELGIDFYALDLRRYGRSLRLGQIRGFITDLDDYAAELDAAAAVIGADHDRLVVMGHSTGGLVTSLWADQHSDRLDGLILNSPWLDLQGSALVRTLGKPVIDALGTRSPTSALKLPDLGFYARTIHATLGGEWDYDLDLKPTPSSAITVGWMRAILLGHQRVAAGLNIDAPVLVLASTATDFSRRWHEGLRQADTVLDADKIAAKAIRLGRHVTVVRIPGGMHDLVLSAPPVREKVLAEMAHFLRAYVHIPASMPDGVSDSSGSTG